jgi:hypothetical protein
LLASATLLWLGDSAVSNALLPKSSLFPTLLLDWH